MPHNPSADYSYEPLQPHHLAHDLRGPLNSMLGFTELLLEGIEGPLNDIQVEDLTAMWQSTHNLLNLINAYVDLSRLNAGLYNLEAGPVNCHDALKLAVKELSATEAAARVSFTTVVPEHFPAISGDFKRVVQMIQLLCQFLIELAGRGSIEISATYANDRVTINIAAEKITLPPDQAAELFEQTVRVDATGRSRLSAGGIFLPLAYQLALRQHGNLSVTSAPDIGTVFTLSLPVYSAD